MIECPKCGLKNQADSAQCRRCGQALTETSIPQAASLPDWLSRLEPDPSNHETSVPPAAAPETPGLSLAPGELPSWLQLPEDFQVSPAGGSALEELPDWLRATDPASSTVSGAKIVQAPEPAYDPRLTASLDLSSVRDPAPALAPE